MMYPDFPADAEIRFPQQVMANRTVEIRVRHEISDAPIWALLSVTENVTNHVTLYFP